MLDRSLLRQCTLALALGAGLQVPALEGPWQERREARPERREDRQERREDRQERREDKQERREDRQERREDQRERRERRPEPPMDARPQPMPRPRPLPRSDPYGQPGGTTQSHPHPRSAPSDPGSTNLSRGNPNAPHSRSRAQAQAWERSHGWRAEGAWGAHPTWREHRARSWESEHRTWAHRGGYGGYYIPESHFRLHFGPERWFRIRTRPMIHMGYPRFRYGNYWFLIVDPWPEFWSETWYADDDVYVDYSDGYYLHNRRHPGISIAISVSL